MINLPTGEMPMLRKMIHPLDLSVLLKVRAVVAGAEAEAKEDKEEVASGVGMMDTWPESVPTSRMSAQEEEGAAESATNVSKKAT